MSLFAHRFHTSVILRFCFGIGVILLALFGPWWLFLPILIISVVVFPWFVEGIFAALTHDVIYGLPVSHLGGTSFFVTILTFFSFGVGAMIRHRIRFFERVE